jgi:hypothetical protein
VPDLCKKIRDNERFASAVKPNKTPFGGEYSQAFF